MLTSEKRFVLLHTEVDGVSKRKNRVRMIEPIASGSFSKSGVDGLPDGDVMALKAG